MESEQKQKKILFAGLTLLVLAGIFLYSASFLDRNTPIIQPVDPQSLVPTEPEAVAPTIDAEPPRVSTLDWKKAQFDACGGKEKYGSLPWWEKFMAHAVKVDYYSESYIRSALKNIAEDTYRNPEKKVYSHDEFCASPHGDSSPICVGRYQKLSAADFDEGEGCLSKDGKGFVAVFPGEYMGGGNHIFRYDISEDAFEEAERFDDDEPTRNPWVAPPRLFGKRSGNIVKMSGRDGDAGCMIETYFDYDFVANTITLKKYCNECSDEPRTCKSL